MEEIMEDTLPSKQDGPSLLPLFNQFVTPQEIRPNGQNLSVDGKNYDLFDKNILFQDWINLLKKKFSLAAKSKRPIYRFDHFRGWAAKNKRPLYPFDQFKGWVAINERPISRFDPFMNLFSVMEEEEAERFENELKTECNIDINKYPEIIDSYFAGGLYNRVRSLACWNQKREQEELLDDENNQLPITWDDKLRLCEKFQDLGIIGNSERMISLYREVAHLCEGIKRYSNPKLLPNILISGAPGTGKQVQAHQLWRHPRAAIRERSVRVRIRRLYRSSGSGQERNS